MSNVSSTTDAMWVGVPVLAKLDAVWAVAPKYTIVIVLLVPLVKAIPSPLIVNAEPV